MARSWPLSVGARTHARTLIVRLPHGGRARVSFEVEGRQRYCSFWRESNQAVNSCGCGRGSNESICGESLCDRNPWQPISFFKSRASQTRLHALGESRSMKRAVKSVKLHTFYEVLKVLGAVRSGYTHTQLNVTCTVSCLPMKIIRLGTF